MAITDDSGPAFPQTQWGNTNGTAWGRGQGGMSLRDYFAGQALAGSLASVRHLTRHSCVASCYKAADLMLKEREKGSAENDNSNDTP